MIFERKNNPTTTQEITEFEQGRGVRLPQDYKEFLLSFNGGYVDRRNDYFKVGSWNAFAVEELFGITKARKRRSQPGASQIFLITSALSFYRSAAPAGK